MFLTLLESTYTIVHIDAIKVTQVEPIQNINLCSLFSKKELSSLMVSKTEKNIAIKAGSNPPIKLSKFPAHFMKLSNTTTPFLAQENRPLHCCP